MKNNIKYLYPSEKTCKLSIKTPILFSWGIQENSGKNGESYTIPLLMYNSNEGPTKDERKTIKLMESILKYCKNHLNSDKVKETIEQYNLEHMVNNMDIFYRKNDKGKTAPGISPILYPKLRTAFRRNKNDPLKITTGIYDTNNKKIDALSILNQRCKIVADLIIDNIFIGVKPSIQMKVDSIIVIQKFENVRRLYAEDIDDENEETNENVL